MIAPVNDAERVSEARLKRITERTRELRNLKKQQKTRTVSVGKSNPGGTLPHFKVTMAFHSLNKDKLAMIFSIGTKHLRDKIHNRKWSPPPVREILGSRS
jgi:hypothetical protein